MITNSSTEKLQKLGTERIPKLVFSFFITTFIGIMLNSIYSLTDALFVSWGVGDIAMGGVSIVFPFMLIQGAISTTIGGGAASLVSRKLGEGKPYEAGMVTHNARWLFYIIAIIITVLGIIFMEPMLKAMGATEELLPYAKDYYLIIVIGNIFSTGFSALIRAEGKMFYAMMIWVLPITINIILDAIFILALGWGVKGSAVATIISQIVGFVMSITFFARFSIQKYKNAKLKWRTIGDILKIGLPSLVQMGSLSIITALLNISLSASDGTLGVVIFSYISKLLTFAVAPFMALTQALAPIVGYNFGVGQEKRVKETVAFCVKVSVLYAIAVIALAEAIPQLLLMIFTNDSEIIKVGSGAIRIIAISILFTPLPMLIGAKMQAVGKTFLALVMYGSNMVFIILPAIFLGKYLGLVGVAWAYVIASFCSAAVVAIKMMIDRFKIKKCDSGEISR